MKILHPNKANYLALENLNEFYDAGFYNIIADDEKEKLKYFLNSFEDYRKYYIDRIKDEKLYDNLPFSVNTTEWKERKKEAKIKDRLLLHKQNLNILDIGSWNSWLCNYLAKKGHKVVGVNLFENKFDGVKSNKHYHSKFISLQLHADEIYRIEKQFDLIVFNRNWAYFKNHQTILNDAKKLLAEDGIIIFTGLAFYKNPQKIKENLAFANTTFEKKYGIPLLYKPSKGYLDFNDKSFFKKNEMKLYSYQPFKNLIKRAINKNIFLHYGLYYKIR